MKSIINLISSRLLLVAIAACVMFCFTSCKENDSSIDKSLLGSWYKPDKNNKERMYEVFFVDNGDGGFTAPSGKTTIFTWKILYHGCVRITTRLYGDTAPRNTDYSYNITDNGNTLQLGSDIYKRYW